MHINAHLNTHSTGVPEPCRLFAQDKWTRQQVAAHAAAAADTAAADAAATMHSGVGAAAAAGGAGAGAGGAGVVGGERAAGADQQQAQQGQQQEGGEGAGEPHRRAQGSDAPPASASANYWRTIGLLTAQVGGMGGRVTSGGRLWDG